MIVAHEKDFNKEFPETWNWELIESWRLTPIVREIISEIKWELTKPHEQRNGISGLRHALRIMAEHDI